jgi:hypothetical protein
MKSELNKIRSLQEAVSRVNEAGQGEIKTHFDSLIAQLRYRARPGAYLADMYQGDLEDALAIQQLFVAGNLKKAMARASRLDTSAREEIFAAMGADGDLDAVHQAVRFSDVGLRQVKRMKADGPFIPKGD